MATSEAQPPKLVRGFRRLQRRAGAVVASRTLIERYLAAHPVSKLHIGGGEERLAGWLDSDLDPLVPDVLRLDATRRFPFADASLDYVFSEHMIEHISYEGGQCMLRECQRVLRPGGRIRVATPDLRFLLALHAAPHDELHARYIAWSMREFVPGVERAEPAFVVNNYVRNWGHTFLYDPPTLRGALADAGFVDIVERELDESDDENLAGLEHPERMPEGFLALESMVFEATRR